MTGSSPHDQDSTKSERRAHRRLYVQGRALVLLPPARSFRAETVDISEGGVCLTSPVGLTPGTWCHLRIHVPTASTPELSLSGHVCFCIEFHGVYRVGVHCSESESLIDAVREYDTASRNK